jgi:prepilin-type N-terminal cleavage/methylation domain-containing protein
MPPHPFIAALGALFIKVHSASRGFTYVELLFVVAIASVLVVMGLPRYLRAATHADPSEAMTERKSLAANRRLPTCPPPRIDPVGPQVPQSAPPARIGTGQDGTEPRNDPV